MSNAPATGGTTATGGTEATGGVTAAGGTRNSGGGTSSTNTLSHCSGLTPPTAAGTLTISSGYVTTGTLEGLGYTAVGMHNNSTTCVVPSCDTTGCQPAFGTSALCAAGIVTADTTYNSVVYIGFNLNQPAAGATLGSIAAPPSITVTVVKGAGTGDSNARVIVIDASGTSYCVDGGGWKSGVAIPISSFNTFCWDPTNGKDLVIGTRLTQLNIVVTSDATADQDFSICLTGVTFNSS